jgi:pyruvate kinase
MMPVAIAEIKQQLEELERKMKDEIKSHDFLINKIHPQQLHAAKNLLQYLTLRNEDIRELQDKLHIAGLSSLASSESHIHSQLQSILQRLGKEYSEEELESCDYSFSKKEISNKSTVLFGEKTDAVIPYIMVTFDSSFAKNYGFIKTLLQNGMNVARINCAHDDEATWSRMIHLLKRACHRTGLNCKIYMDLAGPKIRTHLISGGKKGKVKVKEGELTWLAENADGFSNNDIVISPNEPGIIAKLQKNDRVYIDDGMIKGIIEKKKNGKAGMRIVRISSKKQQIKEEKGINFPDTEFSIPSLTEFDKKCLPFMCEYADLIGYSFVRYSTDLTNLQDQIKMHSSKTPFVILKIETPEAVKNLPDLLLQGMHQQVFGAMIARGDLAVEMGFEKMGEIQEEILWICEAAHVPVVWATQVLESLNKSGIATRSEITDASHAAMAECVMINKGDHTIEVIETLQDILQRTGRHHIKKRFSFRPLNIATTFLSKQKPVLE